VLNVINRSPSDIQPVLDTIVQTAARLCEPDYAVIFKQAEDGNYRRAANSKASPAFAEWLRDNPIRVGDGSVISASARSILSLSVRGHATAPRAIAISI
jgi:hypothetical protein